MIYREIQNTRVPALGFGTFQLLGDTCRRQVLKALEAGYRHLDTARVYDNEEEVGRALSESGVDRSEIFLTSKVWMDDLEPAKVRQSADKSLRQLKTDYLDLYLIHWPSDRFPMDATLEALRELQSAGKLRHLGVSNFPPAYFERACGLAPIFCNQVEYHPLLGQERLLELAREHGVLLTAYSPLAQGGVMKEPVLAEIGAKHRKNAAQVALRWLIQQDNVAAIPRTGSEQNLRANFEIFDFELDADDLEKIARLPKNVRVINPAFAPDWEDEE